MSCHTSIVGLLRPPAGAAVLSAVCVFAVSAAAQDLPPADSLIGGDSPVARLDAIRISDISVQGATVFSEEELERMVAPYENRFVTVEELHALRQAISAAYLDRGYVNSGVVIPDQAVSGGSVTLQAVEGGLTQIEIGGVGRVRRRSIERRIQHKVGAPLDIAALQESLRVLQEDPLVERLNAELLPGEAPGESVLRLGVTELPPWEFVVSADNYRAPSVGENRGTLGFAYRGLVGNGDVLSASFGVTEGVDDNSLSYSVPLGPAGTTIDVYYYQQDSDIVEEPFAAIDITSHLDARGITASRPFLRGADRSLVGIAGFENKRSTSSLLGMPFSFSPGDIDGRAEGSAVSLGVEWTRQRGVAGWVARAIVQQGVDALDPTWFEDGSMLAEWPDSDFTAVLGQLQYMRMVGWRESRLLARTAFQLAQDPLLAMYKMPIGGRFTVRGYRENELVRDNGVAASIEYQFPLLVNESGPARSSLMLAFFADYGVSWDEDDALITGEKVHISSVGLGLLWDPIPGLHAEIYWGDALDNLGSPDDSLQDDGFHYEIAFTKLF